LIEFAPTCATGIAVDEERWLGAIAKDRSFLDQQLDLLGIGVEVLQKGPDRAGRAAEEVVVFVIRFLQRRLQLQHSLVDPGKKQLLLAGEIEVQRSLRDLQLGGDALHFTIGVAQPRKQVRRGANDVAASLRAASIFGNWLGPRIHARHFWARKLWCCKKWERD